MSPAQSIKPPVARASTATFNELPTTAPSGRGLSSGSDAFTAVLPAREKSIQRSLGLWQPEAPAQRGPIWAYPDLNARAEARGNAMKDPNAGFLGKGPGFWKRCITIMLPRALAVK